ncbi:MAG TPA: histidine kinase [Thermoleophilia bacterium]|nr:histidine kinase [Thermoleophilia bacterium]
MSFTIRNRLLLYFVCLVVFTAVAIAGITVVIASRDARERVVGQLESVATLKQQQVDSWIGGLRLNLDIVLSEEGIEQDLRTLTRAAPGAAERDAAYRRVLHRFSWVATRVGLFEELLFMGPEGEVLVSTDRGHERQQLGMNDYFTEGMRGEFIQEPSWSLSLNKMTVVASRPVGAGGEALGVLAGRANLDSLNAVMRGRAGLGQTGETYLVGSNHRLLTELRTAGYTIPNAYVRTSGADAAVDGNESGSATYPGYAGQTVIGVYAWIPQLKVALMAEQGEAEALKATRLALWTTGAVALLAALLAIIIGTTLIHSIVRPLSELGETAGRIADGELDLSARVKRDDEIGKLAGSFNRMTGRLRELAASKERQRLARDLHDAVSQTLFSISLMAEVLPRVYEKDPAAGKQRLEELRELTRGALAEMRMLLLELRPAALAETSLPDLLRQLGEAVVGRARIPVDVRIDEAVSPPPAVAVALYRIAQEALNNVVKHAAAGQATVTLRGSTGDGHAGVELTVADDGCGFDIDDVRSGRLGLGIMAERAESIGALLELHSAPAQGTVVRVVWSP